MRSKFKISPSLLSANFLYLEADINFLNNSEAGLLHLDIMDGRFVPNISFGLPIISQIKKIAKKPLDVHLMIVEPENYIDKFADLGADFLTVHYEACPHLHRTVQQIKNHNIKAGVAINPHTNIQLLENVINELDLVLIMSVNPGFGGQKFIENTYKKIEQLKKMIIKRNSKAEISIDGGVTLNNHKQLKECGANILVAGSSIFNAENPEAVISAMAK